MSKKPRAKEPSPSAKLKSSLESLMKAKGLTQKEASEKLQITPITLNRYFRSDSELRADSLTSLLHLLDIHLQPIISKELDATLATDADSQQSPAEQIFDVILHLEKDRRRVLVEFLESFIRGSVPGPQVDRLQLKKVFELI